MLRRSFLACALVTISAASARATPPPMQTVDCTPGSLPGPWSVYVPPSGKVWDLALSGQPERGTILASLTAATGSLRYLRSPDAASFAWSPDGTKVVVAPDTFDLPHGTTTPSPLYVVNTRTNAARTIGASAFYRVQSWLPDGRSVLASVGQPPSTEVIDVVTGAVRAPVGSDFDVLSPNRELAARISGTELQVVDLRTGAVKNVADGTFDTPSFSGDGTRIAFSEAGTGLVVVDVASGTHRIVATRSVVWRAWSPHGATLLWKTTTSRDMRIANMTTGRVRSFDPIPARLRARYAGGPVQLLGDGDQLLYSLGGLGYRIASLDGKRDRRPFACRAGLWKHVVGTPFDDVIDVRNDSGFAYNRVTCGAGRDVVIADKNDRIARDCEVVRR